MKLSTSEDHIVRVNNSLFFDGNQKTFADTRQLYLYFIRNSGGESHHEEGVGAKHEENHHDTHGQKGDKVRSLAIDVVNDEVGSFPFLYRPQYKLSSFPSFSRFLSLSPF